ncbi:triose-phosphate isomerase [Cardinium endosymbiont of Oedothorax gibbosus]|uniref:triose-phosphate isomerase n=1 Tax=Cardinium endosymbiont of Oedothorax gibbosus TaxID=931101 RepID=UPI0020257153|nr:triose-phosphate isomerase [Cardinium endosymbiont of Oedothorax gibbosus]CAH2560201.1 Triosephosphate isomerase [Cardinium endosymbiont of Oedothorax gibbosus]
MQKKYLIGNWKMYKTVQEAIIFMQQLLPQLQAIDTRPLALSIAPSFVHLSTIAALIDDYKSIQLVAQNCHHETEGAFTGEVSAAMLAAIGVGGVLIGHSERRSYQKEDNLLLAKKIKRVLEVGMQPLLCCGESLEARRSGRHKAMVQQQLLESLVGLTPKEIEQLGIAYEPVWAIGTGQVASLEVIIEMHTLIREILSDQCEGAKVPILYGGSCNAQNVKAIFDAPNVAGGLIGSASLKVDQFMKIVIALLGKDGTGHR